jgi:hypothetical protein
VKDPVSATGSVPDEESSSGAATHPAVEDA